MSTTLGLHRDPSLLRGVAYGLLFTIPFWMLVVFGVGLAFGWWL